MTKAVDFFNVSFTNDVLENVAKHTNTYGHINIVKKRTKYSNSDGSWKETDADEMRKFIALLIYTGLVETPTNNRYWSTKTLYHCTWARAFMSRDRFKALLGMLHVDSGSEEKENKLRKISPFISTLKEKCQALFQPYQQVAVDERIVKSKHRSRIRQYIKNKPVEFGIKLWLLADSKSGYTIDFKVHTGSADRDPNAAPLSIHGLGYGVLRNLCKSLEGQGYHMFFDNYYTSPQLVRDSWEKNVPSCGTAAENRRGFPECLKGKDSWDEKA